MDKRLVVLMFLFLNTWPPSHAAPKADPNVNVNVNINVNGAGENGPGENGPGENGPGGNGPGGNRPGENVPGGNGPDNSGSQGGNGVTTTKEKATTSSSDKECAEFCPTIYSPICGSDGVTYINLCELKQASCINGDDKLVLLHDGICRPEKDCPKFCMEIYDPVCGNDEQTYSNLCKLEQASCNDQNVSSVPLYNGICEGDKGCPEFCPTIYSPICGSDAVTYTNLCELKQASCVNGDDKLVLLHDGICSPEKDCPEFCMEIYDPVCGNDEQTYSNLCKLEQASCNDQNVSSWPLYNGICKGGVTTTKEEATTSSSDKGCPEFCPTIHSPICGSDGVTYTNLCELEQASCINGDDKLVLSHDGLCRPE